MAFKGLGIFNGIGALWELWRTKLLGCSTVRGEILDLIAFGLQCTKINLRLGIRKSDHQVGPVSKIKTFGLTFKKQSDKAGPFGLGYGPSHSLFFTKSRRGAESLISDKAVFSHPANKGSKGYLGFSGAYRFRTCAKPGWTELHAQLGSGISVLRLERCSDGSFTTVICCGLLKLLARLMLVVLLRLDRW